MVKEAKEIQKSTFLKFNHLAKLKDNHDIINRCLTFTVEGFGGSSTKAKEYAERVIHYKEWLVKAEEWILAVEADYKHSKAIMYFIEIFHQSIKKKEMIKKTYSAYRIIVKLVKLQENGHEMVYHESDDLLMCSKCHDYNIKPEQLLEGHAKITKCAEHVTQEEERINVAQ